MGRGQLEAFLETILCAGRTGQFKGSHGAPAQDFSEGQDGESYSPHVCSCSGKIIRGSPPAIVAMGADPGLHSARNARRIACQLGGKATWTSLVLPDPTYARNYVHRGFDPGITPVRQPWAVLLASDDSNIHGLGFRPKRRTLR